MMLISLMNKTTFFTDWVTKMQENVDDFGNKNIRERL